MTDEPRTTVRADWRFEASAERVFDAWLDPEIARCFLFATDTGQMVRVAIDPRVEGHFAFVDRRDGEDVEHLGQYLEMDRPRRLAFSFVVPKFSSEATKVVVEINPAGSGCELALIHEGVFAGYADRTLADRMKILERLDKALA